MMATVTVGNLWSRSSLLLVMAVPFLLVTMSHQQVYFENKANSCSDTQTVLAKTLSKHPECFQFSSQQLQDWGSQAAVEQSSLFFYD